MTDITFTDKITVTPITVCASDLMVVAAAQVSTRGVDSLDVLESGTDPVKLIQYLMNNKHGTPFEHNMFTFMVHAPIFVFREFHRHRIGWSYNEESGRYKQLDPVFYLPDMNRDIAQIPGGKPGQYEYGPGTSEQYQDLWDTHQETGSLAYASYERLLAMGVAKEVARMYLPLSIYSSMYATCNARSLMAFLSLRRKMSSEQAMFPSKPMKEIDIVAEKIEAAFRDAMPETYGAYVRARRVAP